MSLLRAPLWQQLLLLWGAALLIASVLLWAETRQPYKFYWLVPYPSWRAWAPIIGELVPVRPLLAMALVGIPAVATLASLALCLARLAPLFRAARAD